MRIYPLIFIIFYSFCGITLARNLNNIPDYKTGLSALHDHLHQLAASKFQKVLKVKDLSKTDRIKLLLLLSQAQVKSSQVEAALSTLSDPLIKNHPDAPFWRGLAYTISGRFLQAIEALAQIKSSNHYFPQATITQANLHLALGDDSSAIPLLKKLAHNNKSSLSNKAKIKLAEIYLNQDDDINAAKFIDAIKKNTASSDKLKKLLKARLHIRNKDYPAAISELKEILKTPQGLNARTSIAAVISLADARYKNNLHHEALQGLFDFISTHPDTPLLDKLFTRIALWIPTNNTEAAPYNLKLLKWANRDNNKLENNTNTDLQAFAHYYYALSLSNSKSPAILKKALFEFSLLRLRHPSHILAGSSLTETARIQLLLKRTDDAITTLKLIQSLKITISPIAKQQAALLLAQLQVKQLHFKQAAKYFLIARQGNQRAIHDAATINAGLAYLSEADEEGFKSLIKSIKQNQLKASLTLEHALWLAKKKAPNARTALQEFIHAYPKHPRRTEALMALASHAISVPPIDSELCQNSLEQLANTQFTEKEYEKISFIRYRLAIAHSDYLGAIAATENYLTTYPKGAQAINFTLLKGQALYRNGEHNKARQTLTSLAAAHPKHPLTPYALYYAALSARLEGTPQSQLESLALFQQVIDTKSAISPEATLQKAELLTKLNQPDQAIKLLTPIYHPAQTTTIQRDIAISLASAHYALGTQNKNHYLKALSIYDALLTQPKLPLLWKHRILYRKALTYQATQQTQKALEAYYDVINIDKNSPPITQWRWYYQSGFNAIAILIENDNPAAAIAIAKKMAQSHGPRAEDAAHRARLLEMKYMIWSE